MLLLLLESTHRSGPEIHAFSTFVLYLLYHVAYPVFPKERIAILKWSKKQHSNLSKLAKITLTLLILNEIQTIICLHINEEKKKMD